jgi:predicted dithiol-disulfide oxidoreductase (DUF899 family)
MEETMQSTAAQSKAGKVVTPTEWLEARKALLKKEKELTHLRDEISRQRRELPWEKVAKNYRFEGPNGELTLGELFAGKSQLIIYHFMFGPEWMEGCPSCSLIADGFDGSAPHLRARDVTLMAVSRAPIAKIAEFKNRMGWKFPWVSSYGSNFNRDFHVAFTKEEVATGKTEYNYTTFAFPSEEAPGASVFYKDAEGNIFHTYSSFGRGLDNCIGPYNFLDIAPKGRDEDQLAFSMSWVRHHDRYEDGVLADASRPYWPEAGGAPATVPTAPKKADPGCCGGETRA